MPSNALTQKTIDATLTALNNNNDGNASANDGASLIDNWIKVLQESQSGTNVLDQLMQLRALLQMPQPDNDQVKQLLNDLADNTTQMAQSSEGPWINELEQVVVALRTFSNQL